VAKTLDESKLRSRHRNAYIALYIVGGLTLLLGLVAELGRYDPPAAEQLQQDVDAAEGLILIVLGYFTMRGSLLALGIALGLYAIDAIVTLAIAGIRGIWLRLLVLFFLVQGFMALRELKRRQTVAAISGSPPSSPAASEPSIPRQERPTTS
jgi:hypothetical protein